VLQQLADAAPEMRGAMTEAGFPPDGGAIHLYEYGRVNTRRRKGEPYHKWYALTPQHRVFDLLDGRRERVVNLRYAAATAKRARVDVDQTAEPRLVLKKAKTSDDDDNDKT
jgi:hypothetical protein